MKVIFRFLAKMFSDVAWFFAELSGDVETQTRDDGVIFTASIMQKGGLYEKNTQLLETILGRQIHEF